MVVEAIAKAGYTGKVFIGMDVAASEFFTEDKVLWASMCVRLCVPVAHVCVCVCACVRVCVRARACVSVPHVCACVSN